jgi:hypothetical protein
MASGTKSRRASIDCNLATRTNFNTEKLALKCALFCVGGSILSKSTRHPNLYLIDSGKGNPAAEVAHPESIVQFDSVQAVKMEARAFEARHGKNPYSDFILRHGRRPDQNEAAGMGRMMNLRLRAVDGSLQPKLTKSEKAAWQNFGSLKVEAQRKRSEIRRLMGAIRDLASASISPAGLACEIDPTREHVELALGYLLRFVEELRGDETGKSPRST